MRKPRVFLFDEPLSNLDAKLRAQMRVELLKLHRQLGATSVYVTHDQIEAMTMGDRIVVMHDGRVQQIGAPMEIYRKPVNRFVAGFIGTPAMNFLPAQLQMADTGLKLRGDGFEVALGFEQASALANRDCAEVVMGIRPRTCYCSRWCEAANRCARASRSWKRSGRTSSSISLTPAIR